MNEHEKAIEDCIVACQIDSTYSKAYGRKGWVSQYSFVYVHVVKGFLKLFLNLLIPFVLWLHFVVDTFIAKYCHS